MCLAPSSLSSCLPCLHIKKKVFMKLYHSDTRFIFTFHISDCAGPLKPEVVDSTEHATGRFPASNVLILGEEDAQWRNRTSNYWLAEVRKTTDQGFTMKVDN